jgi:hypothetical protein
VGQVTTKQLPPDPSGLGARGVCQRRLTALAVDQSEIVKRSVDPPEVLGLAIEKDAADGVIDRLIDVPCTKLKDGELVVGDRRFTTLCRFEFCQTVGKNVAGVERASGIFKGQPTLEEFERARWDGTISTDQVFPHSKGIHAYSTFPGLPRSVASFNATI